MLQVISNGCQTIRSFITQKSNKVHKKEKKKDSKFSKNLQLEKDKEKSTKPSIHLSNQSPIMDYLLLHEPIQLVSCK
jgi:hypothetical protein